MEHTGGPFCRTKRTAYYDDLQNPYGPFDPDDRRFGVEEDRIMTTFRIHTGLLIQTINVLESFIGHRLKNTSGNEPIRFNGRLDVILI